MSRRHDAIEESLADIFHRVEMALDDWDDLRRAGVWRAIAHRCFQVADTLDPRPGRGGKRKDHHHDS